MAPYHSALAAGCYLQGFSVDRTERLFNSFVFAQLGYFDAYRQAVDFLQKEALRLGYELQAVLKDSSSCFMHIINHPRISFLYEIARQALAKAEIETSADYVEGMVRDELASSVVWPVFPEIARRLGIEGGSYTFARNSGTTQGKVIDNLTQFLNSAFGEYEKIGPVFSARQIDRVQSFIKAQTIG
jgi:hypothetical protein